MLKALAPITTLILLSAAGLTELSTYKIINIAVIVLAVVMSSIGEFQFALMGFISQTLGTVAESAHLVLMQRFLAACPHSPERSQQPNAGDDEMALTSSRSSSDHESDNENSGAPSSYHSEDDDWNGRPIDRHGASETSQDELGNRDCGEAKQTSSLSCLYYYAPVWAFLNLLMALVFERPEFDWKDLERVGVGMLALSGALASLASVMSFLLIGRTSALTLSFADILKSILLVGASVTIWATPITGLQAFGYFVSLAGMSYLALSANSDSPRVVLMEGLRRYAGRSKG
ncbi:hypothetical protein KVR01_007486 [Diaporthe batatas]|uniref:uncharacterized protein n=1 Tax=Diaporthe batatas TaxID=748121 RepID=UPI001D05672C|nr:uncharacterized protein KVR01_007486 [Diaporthe batatas]KAG8163008.1 hypothetical protein KVR01_007486 [Diaporthe batatas]